MAEKKSKISSGPFGDLETKVTADFPAFEGTHDDFLARLGDGFRPKMSNVLVSDTSTKLAKKKKKKVVKKPMSQIIPASKRFDRNTDGATPTEIEAARHMITNLISVPRGTSDSYVDRLDSMTKDFTHFLLTEIAPFESAWTNALADASESIRMITGMQRGDFASGRAGTIIAKMPELKTLDYLCSQFNLPPDIRSALIAEYMGTDNGKKQSEMSRILKLAIKAGQPNGTPQRAHAGDSVHRRPERNKKQERVETLPALKSKKEASAPEINELRKLMRR
jgi:hypothetical protein